MTFTANKAVFFVHLAKPLMTFPLQILLSFLFLISPHLSSHPNPVTSFINISALAPLSFLSHTCFFSPFNSASHVNASFHTHLFCTFPPRFPGGLAAEHHHHRQLHEQVQPSVLIPAAAQAHGVEPP